VAENFISSDRLELFMKAYQEVHNIVAAFREDVRGTKDSILKEIEEGREKMEDFSNFFKNEICKIIEEKNVNIYNKLDNISSAISDVNSEISVINKVFNKWAWAAGGIVFLITVISTMAQFGWIKIIFLKGN
jgi:hypothetical protein